MTMINLIKSDLYKMAKMKSLFVFNIIITLFNLLQAALSDEMSFSNLVSFATMLIPLFVGIFISMFVNSDYKHGYIKNIAGIVSDKIYLVISKIVVSAIFIFICFAVHILTGVLFSFIFCESAISFTNMSASLTYLGLQYILNIALAMISIMLVTLTKNGAFAYIFAVLITTGFIGGIINGVWFIMQKKEIVPQSIDISDFFLTTYLFENSDAFKSIITAIIYFAAAVIISLITIKKKDIG